eukprot:SAG31_NODE_1576_length_7838_cov_5.738468_6_plen_86_part_00
MHGVRMPSCRPVALPSVPTRLEIWFAMLAEPSLVENMRKGNEGVNAMLEACLKPEDKPTPVCLLILSERAESSHAVATIISRQAL